MLKSITVSNCSEIKINSNPSTFESSYNVLGIHHYSYHKRGYRILSESSSLLSENSVAIQNLVCVHGMKFRARISLISPRSIPRRSVDACTHASIAQTGLRVSVATRMHTLWESDTRDMQQTFPCAIYASTRHRNRSRNRSVDRSTVLPCDKGAGELPRWQTSIDTQLRLTPELCSSLPAWLLYDSPTAILTRA